MSITSQVNRIKNGGVIDRELPISFIFDSKEYGGYVGDTLASALLANGVNIVGRSFKYHRPRGIFSAGVDEPNGLVQLETGNYSTPNISATQIELYKGLSATSQNRWPNLKFDVKAISGLFSNFMPPGFYYKTFMWPKLMWKHYEWFIRNFAGLGNCPKKSDKENYDQVNIYSDVVIVGGGIAGLTAALAAARSGARVILVEQENRFGGSLLNEPSDLNDLPTVDWLSNLKNELSSYDNATLLTRTTVFGYYDNNLLYFLERLNDHISLADREIVKPRQRLWRVRAKQVVLATGALERPLIFKNNDKPGVMLASGVRTYIERYAVLPGKNIVIFTNNDDAYRTVFSILKAGGNIVAVVDLRNDVNGHLPKLVRNLDIEVICGSGIVDVSGNKAVSSVKLSKLSNSGKKVIGNIRNLKCDLVACSGGWNPTVHLFAQSGGKLKWNTNISAFVPGDNNNNVTCTGMIKNTFNSSDCIAEGFSTGKHAAESAGFKDGVTNLQPPDLIDIQQRPQKPLWVVPGYNTNNLNRHFVDLQNDVTVADIKLAVREGYISIEHLKRYTTTGMGPDQGKTANLNALTIFADELGDAIPNLGITTFRPPYTPITIGAMVGRNKGELFDPVRNLPAQEWHKENGAVFENIGQWKRPFYYPKVGESPTAAILREARAIRNNIGIIDVSTFGKLEIRGPDTVKLLNRVYTNSWETLEVGRCRYGLMLYEKGTVFDDGVTMRLQEDLYVMSTTSGNASQVYQWLEYWLQCYWKDLKVYITDVTEYWAQVAVSGPNARQLVNDIIDDIDFSPDSFRHMQIYEGSISNIPIRIARISFSGELTFEIAVPSHNMVTVLNKLLEAGDKYSATLCGLGASNVLRIEKGHIIINEDTDGDQNPYDLGLKWLVPNEKNQDFLGRRSLMLDEFRREDRKHLVGLSPHDTKLVLPVGIPAVAKTSKNSSLNLIGYVTSSAYSVALNRSIALCLLQNGKNLNGQDIDLMIGDDIVKAKVVEPCFFDPNGTRINA